uniref:Uncharacterized protein n=1 Tax=Arion vulgaris TaxID=1028688 RepID=A0A0B7ASK1_9EUPU
MNNKWEKIAWMFKRNMENTGGNKIERLWPDVGNKGNRTATIEIFCGIRMCQTGHAEDIDRHCVCPDIFITFVNRIYY